MNIAKIMVTVYMSAVLALAGCAAFEPEPYKLERTVSTISVKVDPMLGGTAGMGQLAGNHNSGTLGEAKVVGDHCYITLREYPACLAHEVRHCYEGAWHPAASDTFPGNSDDCDQGWGGAR